MIELDDKATNTKIVYLYVKEFTWTNIESRENTAGHPKKDRLYRGVFNTDTKTYRLFYKEDEAVYLPTLTATTDNEFGYLSNIVEVTVQNVLELDINDEDLTEFVKWVEDDNATLKNTMGINQGQPKQKPVTEAEFMKAMQATQEGREQLEFLAELRSLREVNLPVFSALTDLVSYLVNVDVPEGADSFVDTAWMNVSKTLGAGKNISRAIEHLARYGGENRRTNLSGTDLMIALKALLEEQARRNFHGMYE